MENFEETNNKDLKFQSGDSEIKNNSEKSDSIILNSDVDFENKSVDPGFTTDDDKIDSDTGQNRPEKLKDVRNSSNIERSDALNYGNDRENGAYNPKNI